MEHKFDVVQGIRFPARLAQSLTRAELDEFLKVRNLTEHHTRKIGVFYHEVFVGPFNI